MFCIKEALGVLITKMEVFCYFPQLIGKCEKQAWQRMMQAVQASFLQNTPLLQVPSFILSRVTLLPGLVD